MCTTITKMEDDSRGKTDKGTEKTESKVGEKKQRKPMREEGNKNRRGDNNRGRRKEEDTELYQERHAGRHLKERKWKKTIKKIQGTERGNWSRGEKKVKNNTCSKGHQKRNELNKYAG